MERGEIKRREERELGLSESTYSVVINIGLIVSCMALWHLENSGMLSVEDSLM